MYKIKLSFSLAVWLVFICHHANSQQILPIGQKYMLHESIEVQVSGYVEGEKKKEFIPGPILNVLKKDVRPDYADEIADEFFAGFWRPYIHAQGWKRTRLGIQMPEAQSDSDSNTGARIFEYKLAEKDVWLPVGRSLEHWHKAFKAREVKLSNGKSIWIERTAESLSHSLQSKSMNFNVRTDWGGTGSRAGFEVIRRFAMEHLEVLRKKFDVIRFFVFRQPRKDGFHFRPQLNVFLLKKSPTEFWLVQKLQFVMFEGDKSHASMIWYVPSDLSPNSAPETLQAEAKLLHERFGIPAANYGKMKTSIIMAIWPADEIGGKMLRFGTIFQKQSNGEWAISSDAAD